VTTETTTAAAPSGTPTSTDSAATTTASAAPAADATTTTAAPAAVVAAAAPTTTEAPATPQVKAPAAYDFKTADGKVDSSVLSKFEGLARELDLTQEQAAKMIDQIAPEMSKAQQARLETARTGWMEASKTDKEFGGEKLQENMAIAKKALETFGSPELTKLLNESGLGNHPEIIRAFYRAGQKISSGNFVPSGQGASQAASAGSKLYPTMK
jgi:Spy/CpxP family protein refolding chaperone